MALPQAADPSQSSAASPVPSFGSLLSPGSAVQTGDRTAADPVLADLRLDQVIEAAAAKAAEYEMVASLLSQPVSDAGILTYRQKMFHDLEDAALFEAAKAFASRMREVRAHLVQLAGMRSAQQRQGRFLDAAAIYCDAVQNLAADLASRRLASPGLLALRDYLAGYLDSAAFARLAADTTDRRKELAQVRYLVRIKGLRVDVSRYDGEADYGGPEFLPAGDLRRVETVLRLGHVRPGAGRQADRQWHACRHQRLRAA